MQSPLLKNLSSCDYDGDEQGCLEETRLEGLKLSEDIINEIHRLGGNDSLEKTILMLTKVLEKYMCLLDFKKCAKVIVTFVFSETVRWIRNKDQLSQEVRNLKQQKLKQKKSVFKGGTNRDDLFLSHSSGHVDEDTHCINAKLNGDCRC